MLQTVATSKQIKLFLIIENIKQQLQISVAETNCSNVARYVFNLYVDSNCIWGLRFGQQQLRNFLTLLK